ncbi:hypothetical protein [Rhizosphaericola mali]|uniref:Uncharacterized protein n=1 Tax=Rhizosphaericola mali TaxID=2545455 RepID=A0A5P2FVM1_9BACT|nr:hypothetical protein [Rhizosphaericola mali]QES87185.1 hypothetical protein E0W69_000380 [Rhizosphaericola mali]
MSKSTTLKNLKDLSPELYRDVRTAYEKMQLTHKDSGINLEDCIRDVLERQYHIRINILDTLKKNLKYTINFKKEVEKSDNEFKSYTKALESALSAALDRLLIEHKISHKPLKECFL